MIKRTVGITGMLLLPWVTWGANQAFYCPQRSGYINVGMTQSQVINACGQPLSKQQTNQPITQPVPVKQLIYNRQGDNKAFYGVWALPIGTSNTGMLQPFGGNSGGGAQLQVNIINNKISSILLNGNTTNAFSICGGSNIEIGDPMTSVYGACGTPSLVNSTFINQIVPSATRPEIWVYQPGQYQSPVSLTFVDGKLQSID
ncbi:MAG: DUF2845 domain-containing protein [Legionella sp.]|nr:DUF2845 domain-containing protein [Legionella sp.]